MKNIYVFIIFFKKYIKYKMALDESKVPRINKGDAMPGYIDNAYL